jgi:RNA polymerase sigma factor (sigma-70 family)
MDENVGHDWVERAKRGEPAAIAELYRRYWRAARAAAYGVTGDLSLAEDAASEAFGAALDGLSSLRDAQRFGPWLRTITARTARRLKAALAVQNGAQRRAPVEAQEEWAPDARLEQQELAALVQEAVRSLPPILREAVSLFYFEGYRVEEAARFLDVPIGTVKRRLHDGRRRLRTAAQQIAQGSKPMDEQREQILQQFRDAAEQGLDSEAFYQIVRKATRLGPVPQDLVRDIMKRQVAAKRPEGGPLLTPEKEERIREALRRLHEPSERARDPHHPVGAVAGAIRQALPQFRTWQIDLSQVDLNTAARKLYEGQRPEALSYLFPPGFAEESSGAYLTVERSLLIEDEDGSVLTMGELLERKDTQEAFRARLREGSRLSDVLDLTWKEPAPLELRAVEKLLHELSEKIVPGVAVHFVSHREPRFRAALRMQLGDDRIPAAIGGVLHRWAALPEGIHVASVTLYLEPWAAAHSGQAVKLAEGSVFPSFQQSE